MAKNPRAESLHEARVLTAEESDDLINRDWVDRPEVSTATLAEHAYANHTAYLQTGDLVRRQKAALFYEKAIEKAKSPLGQAQLLIYNGSMLVNGPGLNRQDLDLASQQLAAAARIINRGGRGITRRYKDDTAALAYQLSQVEAHLEIRRFDLDSEDAEAGRTTVSLVESELSHIDAAEWSPTVVISGQLALEDTITIEIPRIVTLPDVDEVGGWDPDEEQTGEIIIDERVLSGVAEASRLEENS